jgi:hypothetical protein
MKSTGYLDKDKLWRESKKKTGRSRESLLAVGQVSFTGASTKRGIPDCHFRCKLEGKDKFYRFCLMYFCASI